MSRKTIDLVNDHIWGELRSDFEDDEDNILIDAWLTADDNEEGTVIAKVNIITGTVEYLDPRAKVNIYAQEEIQKVLDENGFGSESE